MPYRLVGGAEWQVEEILEKSARVWGDDAQIRYANLLTVAMEAVAADPGGHSSKPIGRTGLWLYRLSSARNRIRPQDRVQAPRHIIIYRIVADGGVEILGFAHDRQDIVRAAGKAVRSAP